MNISHLKINCGSLTSLISSPRGNTPPTESDWKKVRNALVKGVDNISEKMIDEAQKIFWKELDYNDEKLSETTMKELCKIYAFEIWGKSALNAGGAKPLAMDKGRLAEQSAMQALSRIDGIDYIKNNRLISNRFFKGVPDIILGKYKKEVTGVKDIKISYDMPSFLFTIMHESSTKSDTWQMRGYLDILGLPEGEICYFLVNMPELMVTDEEKRMGEFYNKFGLPPEDIESRLKQIRFSMNYDEFKDDMKIFRLPVIASASKMKEAHRRVKQARNWIKGLQERFEKPLNLG